MPDTERMTFRVYLDTGAVLEFEAPDLTRTTNTMSGKLTGLEYQDAVGKDVPRYLDLDRVVAITREVADA